MSKLNKKPLTFQNHNAEIYFDINKCFHHKFQIQADKIEKLWS